MAAFFSPMSERRYVDRDGEVMEVISMSNQPIKRGDGTWTTCAKLKSITSNNIVEVIYFEDESKFQALHLNRQFLKTFKTLQEIKFEII